MFQSVLFQVDRFKPCFRRKGAVGTGLTPEQVAILNSVAGISAKADTNESNIQIMLQL